MKFQRTYSLKIQVDDFSKPNNTIEVDYPLTLDLDVSRSTLASANTGNFTIYNLKEETRRRIFHDRYATNIYRRVILSAGYQGQRPLPIIFQGNILCASSQRQGQDWLTHIECLDGGFGVVNSQASLTLPAGTKPQSAIQTLLQSLQNIKPGVVGSDLGATGSRGVSFVGNSWDLINRIAGPDGNAFVDNEQANVISKNTFLPLETGISLITSDTGLLNTPKRQDAIITLDMIFEPRAQVGQRVQVRSLETINNGLYRVDGVAHRGTISGAVDRGVITTLSLWAGTLGLKAAA